MMFGVRYHVFLFFVVLSALAPVPARAAGTSVQILDGMWLAALSSEAFKIDAQGHEHAFFGEVEMYYAYNDGNGWRYELIENLAGYNSSYSHQNLVIDADGYVHITYDNGDFRYANNRSGDWVVETVEDIGTNDASALAVGPDAAAHILSFDDNSSSLEYTTNVSGTWVNELLDSSNGFGFGFLPPVDVAIGLGQDNLVRLAFAFSNQLFFAVQDGAGGWDATTVDNTNAGRNLTMALDDDDVVHLAYEGAGSDLEYATNASGSWVFATLDAGNADDPSIAIDDSGFVFISYYESDSDTLRVTHNVAGDFAVFDVDDDVALGSIYSSMAIDPSGNPVILYFDDGDGLLSIVREDRLGTDWNAIERLLLANERPVGEDTTLAVASDGDLGLAYTAYSLEDNAYVVLWYASRAVDGDWSRELVDDTLVGLASVSNPNLIFDSSGNAYISYFNGDDLSTRAATNVSGSWVLGDVASSTYADSDVIVNDADVAHVVVKSQTDDNFDIYTDDGSGGWDGPNTVDNAAGSEAEPFGLVKDSSDNFWHCAAAGDVVCRVNTAVPWALSVVDTGSTFGAVSVTIDADDFLHVAYYDITNTNLKYATNATGSWVPTTVDNTADVGLYNSIALDEAGNAYIAYYDATNGDLKYAANSTGSWVLTTVDSTGDVGQSVSAVYSGSALMMSYYDNTNSDLKFATVSFAADETECEDSLDNDSDTLVDCADSDCSGEAVCDYPVEEPSSETECEDDLDNDSDALTDCDDSDCAADAACEEPAVTTETVCNDTLDDDADTLVDCDDTDCAADPVCEPGAVETVCNDTLDDDADTLVDCDDTDCAADPVCELGTTSETECDDDADNDADSLIDCDDTDCAADAACATSGDDDDSSSSSGGCQLQTSPQGGESAGVLWLGLPILLLAAKRRWDSVLP